VPDLVPVKKTVTRGQSTFAQTYWVRNEDLAKKVRAGNETEAMKMAGASDAAVEQTRWAMEDWEHSIDTDRALELRGAFMKVFGTESMVEADASRIGAHYAWPPRSGIVSEAIERGTRDADLISGATALAKASQAAYDTETVKLYRGLHHQHPGGEIRTDSLASFTEDPRVAVLFARGGKGSVLEFEVPRSSIAMSWRASHELGDTEGEVVVATKGSLVGKPYQPSQLAE
jgi:hypothetical protein